jgi:uncharacterized ferritin-like protein (DUF455 family)
MLRARLRELGHDYGDFDAHNGLWEMAEKTAHDGWRGWRWCRGCWRRAGWM